MKAMVFFRVALLVCLCSGGCSKGSSTSSTGSTTSPGGGTSSAPPPAAAGLATISGRAPASTFAIVVLDPESERTLPPQDSPPVMDQIGATFAPELLFVRTGQPAEFRNSDDTLHNV